MANFIFNTTFTINDSAQQWWIQWMHQNYVVAIKNVAPSASVELYAIDGTATAGSRSYSAMWRCTTLQELGAVRTESMRQCQKLLALQGERCLSFSTLMRGLPLETP